MFKTKPALKDELQKTINAKYKEMELSTKEERVQLLKYHFFALTKAIREKERYTTEHDLLEVPN